MNRPTVPIDESKLVMRSVAIHVFLILVALTNQAALAIDYPYQTAEPQKTGWPLSDEERTYVLQPEHERRPGREANKHLPAMWPVVPSAGNWGGTSWLDTHAKLVEQVRQNTGPCDVLLVGDSITIQWGDSWKKHFPDLKAINIGIGGDKTQNVLWRLDHGGVDGLQPKLILLMIGNNNMFFTPETGIEPAAKGIEMCVKNLRDKFPQTPISSLPRFYPHTLPAIASTKTSKRRILPSTCFSSRSSSMSTCWTCGTISSSRMDRSEKIYLPPITCIFRPQAMQSMLKN